MSSDGDVRLFATLLVAHRGDDDAVAMLDEAAAQVELGNASEHLRILIDDATPADAALWEVDVVGASGVRVGQPLFSYLAGRGTLAMFRYVAVCTRSGDPVIAVSINEHMRDLWQTSAQLLGDGRPRKQGRVSVVGYGDSQVDAQFFSALSDANLVVVPLDRLEDTGIYQPILRRDASAFHIHGAVELLAITGLWRTMDDAPLDHLQISPGGGAARVRFVQSRMRLLRTPAIPLASLVAPERDLPVPDGFQPVASPAERIARAEAALLPSELTYRAPAEPELQRQQVSASDLALLIGREVVAALLELPGLIWRVAGGQVASLTRRAVDRIAGGETSRFRVLTTRDEDEGDDAGAAERTRGEVERAITTILAGDGLHERLDPIAGEIWSTLVGETLGIVDGDPDCAVLRAGVFGDEALLPVQREVLLGGLTRLPSGIARLAGVDEAGLRSDGDSIEAGPPATPPASGPPVMDDRAAKRLHQDAQRLVLIREHWDAIMARTDGIRAGTKSLYEAAEPFDLTGDVLTLRIDPPRNKRTITRASEKGRVAALREAIRLELGGGPLDVRTIVRGEASASMWTRSVSVGWLADITGLDVEAVGRGLETLGLEHLSVTSLLTAEQVTGLLGPTVDPQKSPKLTKALGEFLDAGGRRLLAAGAPPLSEFLEARLDAGGGSSDAPSDDPTSNGGRTAITSLPPVVVPAIANSEPEDGLLVRLWSGLARQRVSADRDIRRLVEVLRREDQVAGRLPIARSVPIGAAVGIVLLIVRLGLSDRAVGWLQSREWSIYALDLTFTLATLLILAIALFLTDIGMGLGAQTRTVVFGGGAVAVFAFTWVFFGSLRGLVTGSIRENRTFAILLAVNTILFVAYSARRSWRSGDPLRIQGSRVLGMAVLVYALAGFVFLQSRPESWAATRDPEFATRFDRVLLIVGLALVITAVVVITVIRFRESRRADNSSDVRDWALRALADAVETRELLGMAERQWLASLAVLAQLFRAPFGPVAADGGDTDALGGARILKSASVRLTLNDRGLADLESRLRQELLGSSWLRQQYERMVDAYRELLATRIGVPAVDLLDRRPEADVVVPSDEELAAGQGRGDRFEFAMIAAEGGLDDARGAVIEALDVTKIFQPMLADRSVQVLEGFDGRAATVRDFFSHVLPASEALIPTNALRTALAANEEARRMRSFVWWPERMLGAPVMPADVEVERFATDIFRRGVVGGAGLVSVRVDVSGDFAYDEVEGTRDGRAESGPEIARETSGATSSQPSAPRRSKGL